MITAGHLSRLRCLSFGALLAVTHAFFAPSATILRSFRVTTDAPAASLSVTSRPRPKLVGYGGKADGSTVVSMMMGQTRRNVLRMPSAEPLVPRRSKDGQVASWMPLGQHWVESRVIVVGKFIDAEYANMLIAMLLYFDTKDNSQISLHFSCPGALIQPALAVYDTIMHLESNVETLNMGLATGMISFLCAAGTPGKRRAMPNSRFLMQRSGMEDSYQGQASDIGVEVHNVLKWNLVVEETLQAITGHPLSKIREDFNRDFYLSSQEAVEYRIIDEVLLPKSQKSSVNPTFGAFEGDQQRYGHITGDGWGGQREKDVETFTPDTE